MRTILTSVAIVTSLLTAAPTFAQIGPRPGHGAHAKPTASKAPRAKAQRIEIAVTAEGFVPAQTRVKVGQPVILVVTRKVDRTCATDIVIKELGISKPLPLDTPVEVTFTPKQPGRIRFACAMDMIAGELVAE